MRKYGQDKYILTNSGATVPPPRGRDEPGSVPRRARSPAVWRTGGCRVSPPRSFRKGGHRPGDARRRGGTEGHHRLEGPVVPPARSPRTSSVNPAGTSPPHGHRPSGTASPGPAKGPGTGTRVSHPSRPRRPAPAGRGPGDGGDLQRADDPDPVRRMNPRGGFRIDPRQLGVERRPPSDSQRLESSSRTRGSVGSGSSPAAGRGCTSPFRRPASGPSPCPDPAIARSASRMYLPASYGSSGSATSIR